MGGIAVPQFVEGVHEMTPDEIVNLVATVLTTLAALYFFVPRSNLDLAGDHETVAGEREHRV